jgi:hypothetical protein
MSATTIKKKQKAAFWYESEAKNKQVREKLEVFTQSCTTRKAQPLILRIR